LKNFTVPFCIEVPYLLATTITEKKQKSTKLKLLTCIIDTIQEKIMTDAQINELEGFVLRIYDLTDNAQLAQLDPNYTHLTDNNEKFSSLVALLHDFVDFAEELEREDSKS
tara:strand:- start:34 stop:366 length:333 start_codon:yes stop_codon:yes gene_type:complete